ncbi:MAG: methyltransferase domain-containing protein [Verrucomicrobia bacterium]|nr:MAG: methyltransferase domain-containing protein [Verrucomicrobiota bacterium]
MRFGLAPAGPGGYQRSGPKPMGHQETYRHNAEYAAFLAGQDEGFFAKYADTLRPDRPGGRVLDVGCGVGQVVRRLREAGFDALGVEVSEPSVERAVAAGLPCRLYDGRQLPFPDAHFAAVGAFNVLEHVEEPEAFIPEMVRVTEPGGRVVISSPNFLRALGWRDYHRHMRGPANKWRNFRRLLAKRRQMRRAPETVRFDRMEPVFKEPFEPDDDAIIATNGLEIAFFLERAGCRVERIECTDRYVPRLIDRLLNLTPLRFLMFNAFVVARKRS